MTSLSFDIGPFVIVKTIGSSMRDDKHQGKIEVSGESMSGHAVNNNSIFPANTSALSLYKDCLSAL